jgi:hypothetical protein
MQFTLPADRAQRSPKGVGSIEFDRRSASGAYQTQLAHLAALFGELTSAAIVLREQPGFYE